MQRRTLLGRSAVLTAGLAAGLPLIIQETNAMSNTPQWDKTFPKSDRVDTRSVTFRTIYGTTVAADLYMPKNVAGPLPAVAVSGPFGAVKEQASGLYAQRLAEAGFLTIAFDPSHTGESTGEPRHVASPDMSTEDFYAAVDFLSTLKDVDPNRIGILGICGFGGFAVNAAAGDPRIRATVASTMYDMCRVTSNGYFDAMDEKARKAARAAIARQRTADAASGTYAPQPGLPEKLTGGEPQFVQDYWHYYKTKRGFHPRSLNSNGNWNVTSFQSFMNAPLLTYAGEIESAVLIVHGEKAHSRYFGEAAFKRLKGDNKRLLIVPGASHTDLYDTDKIPFADIIDFYAQALKA